MKQFWLSLSFLAFLFWSPHIFAQNIPAPTDYVSDHASIFSAQYVTDLSSQLAEFEKQTSNQIAVVTIKSLENL
jgi:uncharacterized membrane protein YgcG